jgi:hypothetical protein
MTALTKASWNIWDLRKSNASVTVEFVRAEVPAKMSFTMSKKDPALRVTKAVADYYSWHENLRLDFINGKPKKAVRHLVSVMLCAAKDETSVDTMRRMFCCKFLRKSRL